MAAVTAPTVSTTYTANTRPHQVVPAGWQHADDSQPSGMCVVCGTVGEWSAVTDLAPNSVGCTLVPPFGV